MPPPIICVNSTLAGQSALERDGIVSPLHQWGFYPEAQDVVLCHRLTRLGILMRAKLGGLDIRLLVQVMWKLLKGSRRIYLVTAPDLLPALPVLKRLFPRIRVVAWVWTAGDVEQHWRQWQACDHVFCLTEGALEVFRSRGQGERATLQYWGVDPGYYMTGATDSRRDDVALLGQSHRDFALALDAAALGGFRMVVTRHVRQAMLRTSASTTLPKQMTIAAAGSHRDVVELFRQSAVSWVPLFADDLNPTGYTNLAESLLSGTPVVIADNSVIPRRVLELPGVYRYHAGDAADLVEKTCTAIMNGRQRPETAAQIRSAAETLLGGHALRSSVEALLR
jgi:glycosyltransferase involved in cell wall biosynthesis